MAGRATDRSTGCRVRHKLTHAVDLADVQRRIETAGGKIVKPIFEFPGGRRFHFTDPDGYELAVWTEA